MSGKTRFEDQDECGESATAEIVDEVRWQAAQAIDDADVVLIEEKVTVSWRGVKSCDHSDRIQSEVRAALQRWMEQKIYEHREWRYLRAGAKAGTVRCRAWKDWDGTRSCGCSGGIPFYIEFLRR